MMVVMVNVVSNDIGTSYDDSEDDVGSVCDNGVHGGDCGCSSAD